VERLRLLYVRVNDLAASFFESTKRYFNARADE
jgi:hypothetical protein